MKRSFSRGPFAPLELMRLNGDRHNTPVISHGIDRVLLHKSRQLASIGNNGPAERFLVRALTYHLIPDVQLELGRNLLNKGHAAAACELVKELVSKELVDHGAVDPDPVEWAFYLRCLLCRGLVRAALTRSKQFSTLRHPELDRMRAAVSLLARGGFEHHSVPDKCRASVHQNVLMSDGDWLDGLTDVLHRNRQRALARQLHSFRGQMFSLGSPAATSQSNANSRGERPAEHVLPLIDSPPRDRFDRVWIRLRAKSERSLIAFARRYIRTRRGMSDDPVAVAVERVAREWRLDSAVFFAIRRSDLVVDALLRGLSSNPELSSSFSVPERRLTWRPRARDARRDPEGRVLVVFGQSARGGDEELRRRPIRGGGSVPRSQSLASGEGISSVTRQCRVSVDNARLNVVWRDHGHL